MSPTYGIRSTDEAVSDPWPRLKTTEQRLDHLHETQEAMLSELSRVSSDVRTNNLEIQKLGGAVANQTKVIIEQFQQLNKRLDEERDENAKDKGQILRDLAALDAKVKQEAEARQKQDSIHGDEITGVKHKAISAEEKASDAHAKAAVANEKATDAHGALAKVKSEMTWLNVAKGTFLAVIVKLISLILEHAEKGLGGGLRWLIGLRSTEDPLMEASIA